ncbi:MAG: response regulator [Gammaproteobacteria bacterium]
MKKSKSILLVDDDKRLGQLVSEYLTEQGFKVDVVMNTLSADKLLMRNKIDLIILDRMLPGEDGLSFLARIRHRHEEIPIIMLTSKSEEIDRIMGLEIGADDYLAKPFNPRELLARINTIFRRTLRTGAKVEVTQPINIGQNIFIPAERCIKTNNDKVPLSSTEFSVLMAFVTHPQITLSRERLLTLVHGVDHIAYDRSIDTQVSRVRKIIETDPEHPRYIQTVWGEGYIFVPDDMKDEQ